jgi:hypothetical protein
MTFAPGVQRVIFKDLENGENNLKVVAQYAQGFLCAPLETPCVPVVPSHQPCQASCGTGHAPGSGGNFPWFDNSCEITAVEGCGETYLFECDDEINVHDFARATIHCRRIFDVCRSFKPRMLSRVKKN